MNADTSTQTNINIHTRALHENIHENSVERDFLLLGLSIKIKSDSVILVKLNTHLCPRLLLHVCECTNVCVFVSALPHIK